MVFKDKCTQHIVFIKATMACELYVRIIEVAIGTVYVSMDIHTVSIQNTTQRYGLVLYEIFSQKHGFNNCRKI